MVSINYAFKEIISKIVYYGPGLSGKTSNLQYVFKKVPAETRGELISLATDADRTLYFDFLPVNVGTVQGFSTKFQLYTVPGQVYYNATRKLVLRGVDGIVFVADSQMEKMDENIESLQNLKENLEEYGYDINQIPMIIQYNKRDLPNAAPIELLQRELNPRGLPYCESIGSTGEGVFNTLKTVCKMVLDQVKSKRMEPARINKPEPVPVASGPSLVARPEPPKPRPEPAHEDHRVIAHGEEMGAPAPQFKSPQFKSEAPPELMKESGTHANIVVSDTPAVEEESSRPEPLHETSFSHNETIEKAVLKEETAEPAQPKEDVEALKNATGSRFVIEDAPWGSPFKSAAKSLFDDEATQISDLSLKMPLPLGKPQMAESRKVRAKKGKFSLFGWLKKSND